MIFTLFCLALMACQTGEKTPVIVDNHYTISGKVDTVITDGTAILSLFNPVTQVKTPLDTAIIANDGSYELNFEFDAPDLYRVDFQKKQYAMLVIAEGQNNICLLYTSPSPRDQRGSRMPSSA